MFDPDRHIRMASVDDTDALLELINFIQPHVPWGREMLSWQFHDGPGGPARVYVVEIDNRIVAQYVSVPYPLAIGNDKVVTAWMIQDVMTHRDFRGQGMLHTLGARALEEIRAAGDYGFTFPNEKSAGSFRRNGWHRLCGVPLRTLELCPTVKCSGASVLRRVDSTADLIIPTASCRFGVNRTESYLDWRYNKPGQAYQLYAVGDGGYVVLKQYQRDDGLVVHICDMVLSDAEQVPAALSSVVMEARGAGAKSLTAWLTKDHPYATAFEARGLMLNDELPVSVYVTGPEDAHETLVEPGCWHITHGDSDIY